MQVLVDHFGYISGSFVCLNYNQVDLRGFGALAQLSNWNGHTVVKTQFYGYKSSPYVLT